MDEGIDVTPTESAGGLDPLYEQMYGQTTDEVAERRVGFPVIPPFPKMILKATKAVPHKTKDGNPGARATIEVIEGPGETKGFKFTDSGDVAWGFVPSRKDKDGRDVGDEKFKGKIASRQGLLNRVRQALGLAFSWPANFSDGAIKAYCDQFPQSKPFVGSVQVEKGNDGVERNRIDWQSVAALDEPEKDASGRPTNKTAEQGAREAIAKANEKLAAKGPATPSAPVQIG